MASDFIKSTPADQPFFVMYTPTTPHLPADDTRYDDMPVSPPRGPEFNSNTMTAGTPPYSRRPPFTAEEIATSDDHYTSMAHATRSFDDAVGRLLDSLGNRAQDTLVIYLSDNGFLYGEHRRTGKNDPWEESVNVPMVVRYPAALPASRAFTSDALVQNVDIASTVADAVGFQWGGDGQSFLPIVERKKQEVRKAALIEQCRGVSRGITDCSGYAFNGARATTPGFQGVITQRYKYVEFDDGSRQLIDLQKDPHEFHDLSRNPRDAGLRRQMVSKLHALMRPKLQTTIATGPDGAVSACGPVLVLLAISLRDLPMPSGFQGQDEPMAFVPRWVRGVQRSRGRQLPVRCGRRSRRADSRSHARVANFTVSSSGPEVSLGAHPPAPTAATSATFTVHQLGVRRRVPMPPGPAGLRESPLGVHAIRPAHVHRPS